MNAARGGTEHAGREHDGHLDAQLPVAVRAFLAEHVAKRRSILALDYDGTLAPFRVERGAAVLPPATHELVQALAREPMTHLAIVSGRPVADLAALLRLDPVPELWGAHGWERRAADGSVWTAPAPGVREVLDEQEAALVASFGRDRIERKSASIAVHWRGVAPADAGVIESAVRSAWAPLTAGGVLAMRGFDGGIELRATGRDKGTVIAAIAEEAGDPTAPFAYVGDDDTDEDAFRALQGRAHALTMRAGASRPTAATVTLPTSAVPALLAGWLAATRAAGQAT